MLLESYQAEISHKIDIYLIPILAIPILAKIDLCVQKDCFTFNVVTIITKSTNMLMIYTCFWTSRYLTLQFTLQLWTEKDPVVGLLNLKTC